MTLYIRSYVPDMDEPRQTPDGRRVVAQLIERHGQSEMVVASLTGEYRTGEDLPSLAVAVYLPVAHWQLENYTDVELAGALPF
jgi:hypothetical protein